MPTKVFFGCDILSELKSVVDELDANDILVVTGAGSMRKTGVLDRVEKLLDEKIVGIFDKVESDPSCETVDDGVEYGGGCDLIVGLGGGSPLDAAKAISAVIGNGGNAVEYIKGKRTNKAGPPIVAIPTTSGTASEVTQVSVLTDRKRMIKKSFSSRFMYPTIALDDPELTKTMPKAVTASSGLDALTHAVEALTSKKSQPIPNVLCLEAARIILDNIITAYDDGNNIQARENMMFGSLMAGFGITHAGAGLAHGLSYSLWKIADTPHGLACGLLLPQVMRFNLGYDGGKYQALASYCGFNNPRDLISRIEKVNEILNVPANLAGLDVKEDDVDSMIELGMSGSTQINPRHVDEKTMAAFIKSMIV